MSYQRRNRIVLSRDGGSQTINKASMANTTVNSMSAANGRAIKAMAQFIETII